MFLNLRKRRLYNARRRRRTAQRSVRLHLEILEDRIALATVNWIGGSGDWNTASNWLDATTMNNHVPLAGDDAVIDVAAAVTVTHSSGTHTVQSLTVSEPFTLSGGTLIVTGNLVQQNGGTFTMTGGILRSATVVGEGGAVLVATAGTLDGVTLGGAIGGVPVPATVQANSTIDVTGGLTFANGSLVDLGSFMRIIGNQTVGGDGEIRLRSAGSQISSFNQTIFGPGLTIDRGAAFTSSIFMNGGSITNHATIRANTGAIRVTGNSGTTFTNAADGVLAADGGNLILTTAWSNAGQIVVNNSIISLGGSFTTDGLGSYTRTGGRIVLQGLLDNTGSIFALDASTGSWNLHNNGMLRGGSLVTSGGAALIVADGGFIPGILDGVTLGATVGGVPESATVKGENHFNVTGGLTFTNGSVVDLNNRQINFVGNQTVGGDGEIRLRGSQGNLITFNQLTFGPGLTIHRGDAFSSVISIGGTGSITNQATIRADAGGQITQGGGGGGFTNAPNGVVAAEGGTLVINATANYAAGTLTGGTWQAIGNSTLRIANADITTNAATIVLDGVSARLTRDQPGANALANLSSNAPAGNFTLRNGANFSRAGSFANNGSLTVGPASTFTTNGTFTQDSSATLATEIGGTPASGQFGRLVTSGAAVLDGTLDVRLVNGYGPDPGLSFPIVSFASRTSDFATINGLTIAGFPLFDAVYAATSLTLNSLAVPADLAFVSVSPPPTIVPGQPVSVPYTVRNLTGTPVAGDWTDSLYLSTDGVLDPSDVLLGRLEHHGGLAGNSSYTETLTATVPGLAERNYRVIVLADSRHLVPQGSRVNDVGASTGTTALSVPILALGGSISGTIANGQDLYFRLDVPAGRDVQIAADFTTSPAAEFVQRYASLPDRTTYDRAAPDLFDLHPRLLLVAPQAGSNYILLHGREGSAAGQPFTIQADFAPLLLSTISPNHGSNLGRTTSKLTGSGFTPSTAVSLTLAGTTRAASSVQFVDGNTLYATFDLTNLAVGAYDIQVLESAQSAVSAGAFLVNARPVGQFNATVNTPSEARPNRRDVPVIIDYYNTGETDIPAPLLTITSMGAVVNAVVRIQGDSFYRSDAIRLLAINQDGPAGILPPGYHGRIILEARPTVTTDGTVVAFDVNSHEDTIENRDSQVNWSDFESSWRPQGISDDAWEQIFAQVTADYGDTFGEYLTALGDTAAYLASLGNNISDVSVLTAFALREADGGLLFPAAATETDATVPGVGPSLTFERQYALTISGRHRQGAFGRGWTHNWELLAATDAAGNVTIDMPERQLFFERQPDTSYRSLPGDDSRLTLVGNRYHLLRPLGTTLEFDVDGRLLAVMDPHGTRVEATYSGSLLTALVNARGERIDISYNAQGHISQVTDAAGRLTEYAYDASGEHLLHVTNTAGTTDYAYASGLGAAREHALTSVTFPDDRHRDYSYDERGRLIRIDRNGDANAVNYSYLSDHGIRVTNDDGVGSTFYPNVYGQPGKVVDATGHVDQVLFDAHGRAIRQSEDGGGASTFHYDQEDSLSRVDVKVGPHGQRFEWGYDATSHRLTSFEDANGNTTTYDRNAQGDLQTIHFADGSTREIDTDPVGQVTAVTDRGGHRTEYTYDTSGREVQTDYDDGSRANFTYNLHGNLTSAADANGITTLTYDAADRLTRITYPDGRFLVFTYDQAGRRISMTDQAGTFTGYGYDTAGRLTTVTTGSSLGSSVVSEYTYDAAGCLARRDLGNGSYTTYAYDSNGRLASLVNFAANDSVNSRFDYVYDAFGRVSQVTTLEGESRYEYDAADRLTRAELPGGRTIDYRYDAMGNRTAVIDSGVTTDYTTDSLNQYTSVGSTDYAYSPATNRISQTTPAGQTVYVYDSVGRLASVTGPGLVITYEFDALGHRTAAVVNGQRTEFLVDPVGDRVVAEYGTAGNLLARYTYGQGLTSRIDALDDASYYDFDGAGSTVGLTGDAATGYVNQYTYLPFGEVLSATETVPNAFQYLATSGGRRESSGVYTLASGTYLAAEGRFLSNQVELGESAFTAPGLLPEINCDGTSLDDLTKQSIPRVEIPDDDYGQGVGTNGASHGGNNPDKGNGGRAWTEGESNGATNGAAIPGSGGNGGSSTGGGSNGATNGANIPGSGGNGGGSTGGRRNAADDISNSGGATSGGGGGSGGSGGSGDGGDGGDGGAGGGGGRGGYPDPLSAGTSGPGGPGPQKKCNGCCTFTIRDSRDPNDIVGPSSFGPEGYVNAIRSYGYTIHFENLATAGAPAQTVLITEQLDPDLDFTTFELGDFGFGATTVDLPDGRNVFSTRVDARDTVGLFVDVSAEINLSSGLVTWSFLSIDPATLDLTAEALAGFLPPNDADHSGEGFVSYRVRGRVGVPTGTEIRSVAVIVFDTNAPIATNQVNPDDPSQGTDPNKEARITIDAGPPTSSVDPLPAVSNAASFQVSWSGNDDFGGSGIVSYDVFVSDDSGPFMHWQNDTAQTSASFTGQDGHTYSFYSVATDNVGNFESNAATVTTTVTVNDAPVASNGDLSTAEDTGTAGTLLATDIDSAALIYSVVDASNAHGTVIITDANTGAYSYSPDANFNGPANFTFKANDGALESNVATVSISVTPVNDAPVADADGPYTVAEGGTLSVSTANGILDGDTDIDSPILIAALVAGPAHAASFTLNADGSFTYVHDGGETSGDSFTYIANDGTADSNVATVSITVTSVNDNTPVFTSAAAFSVAENTTAVGTATATDADLPAQSVTFSITGGVDAAQFSITSDGVLTFNAAPDYEVPTDDGANSVYDLQVTADDGQGLTTVQAISVIVTDVSEGTNSPPTITALASSAGICNQASAGPVTISGSFTDPDTGDTHSLVINWGDGSTQTILAADPRINQVSNTFAVSHTYANGGLFLVTVTLLDNSAASDSETAAAAVVGAGLDGGVLWIIGTSERDRVHIRQTSSNLRVRYDLGRTDGDADEDVDDDPISDDDQDDYDRFRDRVTFAAADVGSIHVVLCASNDRLFVHNNVMIPVTVDGGHGNDRIKTGGGNDTVIDLHGDNRIRTDGGNDAVETGPGLDRIWTDGGDDVIHAGGGDNRIWSGSGNDQVTGGAGHDRIHTDGGNDVIDAGGGNNDVWSGDGDDAVTTGDGDDDIHTDGGDDTINAGGGRNRIWSGSGNDTITTGDGDDEIHADGGDDVIHAGNGRNRVWSGDGNDRIVTGSGNDEIHADGGNDVILAGAGNDEVHAGGGNDIVVGGDGDDVIDGGSGRDLLIGGRGRDCLSGGNGDDILVGGFTDYDNSLWALDKLMAEWSSAANYSTRVANVTSGGGSLVGLGVLLNDITVHDDNDYDTLEGNGDRDLFFYNFEGAGVKDKVKDLKTSGSSAESRRDID